MILLFFFWPFGSRRSASTPWRILSKNDKITKASTSERKEGHFLWGKEGSTERVFGEHTEKPMFSGSGRCIAGRHGNISTQEKNGYKKQNPSQEKLQNGGGENEKNTSIKKAFYLVPQCASVFFICLKFSRIFWENVLAFFYSLSPFFAAMVGGGGKSTPRCQNEITTLSLLCIWRS